MAEVNAFYIFLMKQTAGVLAICWIYYTVPYLYGGYIYTNLLYVRRKTGPPLDQTRKSDSLVLFLIEKKN